MDGQNYIIWKKDIQNDTKILKIIYNATRILKKNQLQYNIIYVLYNRVKSSSKILFTTDLKLNFNGSWT